MVWPKGAIVWSSVMSEEKQILLELLHVGRVYHSGRREFYAVQDVNLTLKDGEFVCLLGPSGSGKSTLLRIVVGLQQPTEGKVLYRGDELRGVNPHASLIFQTFALFPWLTVQENVEIALKARGVPPKICLSRALDVLDRVGLDGFETAYPRELSGGMRQKVGFARAMAVQPELFCLDEPFSALDVLGAEALRGELLELWSEGKIPTRAILMVTHNIEEAVFMADRIIVMEKNPGRIVAEVSVDLPHPRQSKSSSFLKIIDRIYAIMAGQTQPEHIELGTAPGRPGVTRWLPEINIADLLGLLEHIAGSPKQKHDIYLLAEDLGVDSDTLLRLIDAAELLGFVTVGKGDVGLTPLGETLSEASILTRKEVFATRIRRLPVYQWLFTLLQAADHHQLEWGVVRASLELELPPEEAQRQLDTIINWGRYGEVLAYDDQNKLIILEPGFAATGAEGH